MTSQQIADQALQAWRDWKNSVIASRPHCADMHWREFERLCALFQGEMK